MRKTKDKKKIEEKKQLMQEILSCPAILELKNTVEDGYIEKKEERNMQELLFSHSTSKLNTHKCNHFKEFVSHNLFTPVD